MNQGTATVRGRRARRRLFRDPPPRCTRMLTVPSLQTRTRRLVKQPPPAEHHQGRTMRDWVRHAHRTVQGSANGQTEQRFAKSLTVSSVRPRCHATREIALTPADDVPMSRVKFNANTEYAYLQNFKILQSTSIPSMHALWPTHTLQTLLPNTRSTSPSESSRW